MDEEYLKILKGQLEEKGVSFAAGLTDAEIVEVESFHNFKFPPDLKAFLQFALPISQRFVNWREDFRKEALAERLAWPLTGIKFDIEHNAFWLKKWGPQPSDLEQAYRIATLVVAQSPTLIPVFAHRYLPAEPNEPGNPVLSVYQTDIIHYGNDLASYFSNEFKIPCPDWAAKTPRPIRFWDTVIVAWEEDIK